MSETKRWIPLLRKYGRHLPNCARFRPLPYEQSALTTVRNKCTCGFEEALSPAPAESPEEKA